MAGRSEGRAARLIGRLGAVRGLPAWLALAALLLAAPSVGTGWQADDYFHRWILLEGPVLSGEAHNPWELFSFADGDRARNREIMDFGLFPWWTDEGIRLRFFRPLSVATHRIDYRLWPDSPLAMHLQSLAWFAAVVALAATLLRQVPAGPAAGALAALLFAVDDAHGLPAGWIANRNALLGACFGLLALLLHHRWRSARWRPGALLAPLALAAAMLSSESAAGAAAFLAAYALCLDSGSLARRLASLAPYAPVLAGWLLLLRLGGYGAEGSGLYIDPLGSPGAFAAAAPRRALLLLLGLWGLPPSGTALFLPPAAARLLPPLAAVYLGAVALWLLPHLREQPAARFFALGMALALVPVCATFPDDRLLLWCSLGSSGLLGIAIAGRLGGGEAAPRRRGARTVLSGAMLAVLLLVHAVAAPLLLPRVARSFVAVEPFLQRPALDLAGGEALASRHLVILDHPFPFGGCYLVPVRDLAGLPVPRSMHQLAPGGAPLLVSRPDERTLVLRPERGFVSAPLDDLFRSPERPMRAGDRVRAGPMEVEVLALTPDGRPAESRFRFDVPLDDPALDWRRWERGAYVPWKPPPVGARLTLPPGAQ